MTDIELVIKIPEEIHKKIQSGEFWLSCGLNLSNAYDFIKNGTPLPKGHGRLVDLDQMCEEYWDGNYMEIHSDDLDNIKPIIKADTESEE